MEPDEKQVLYFSFLAEILIEKDLRDFFHKHLIIDIKSKEIAAYHCRGFLSLTSPEDLYGLIKEHWEFSRKINTLNQLKKVAVA